MNPGPITTRVARQLDGSSLVQADNTTGVYRGSSFGCGANGTLVPGDYHCTTIGNNGRGWTYVLVSSLPPRCTIAQARKNQQTLADHSVTTTIGFPPPGRPEPNAFGASASA